MIKTLKTVLIQISMKKREAKKHLFILNNYSILIQLLIIYLEFKEFFFNLKNPNSISKLDINNNLL